MTNWYTDPEIHAEDFDEMTALWAALAEDGAEA
jgi:hypothetical protein